MDKVSSDTRSRTMQKIRSKDTKPELEVRRFLHARGFRYRLHNRRLQGSPDVVLARFGAAIFVHGCFWHQHPGCRHSGVPLSNRDYWEPKLRRTVQRDVRHREGLQSQGWRVAVVWECEINEIALRRLEHWLRAATGDE